MAGRLKTAALWLGVVLLIWVAVGLTWRARAYEPSGGDLVLGLVGVPLLLIGGYAALKRALGSLLRPADPPAAKEAAAPAAPARAQAGAANARLRLLVLGGCVKTAVGASTQLLQACAEGSRPELDEHLRDDQGFPVMAARVAELDDVDALQWWEGADLDAALPQGRAWVEQLPDARQRELRLLADVLAESAAALERDLRSAAEQLAESAQAPQKPAGARQAPELPLVQARLVLQRDWEEGDGAALLSWARVWLQRAAPALRFDVQRYLAGAQDGQAGWAWPTAWLDAGAQGFIAPSAGADAREEVWLLAGAYSGVSQSAIDEWVAMGRLYGSRRREGLIAGEAAAAVALLRHQPALGPALFAAALPLPVVASAKALPAADAGGALAQRLVAPLLEVRGVPSVTVGKVLSDVDHRPAAAMEVAMLLSQQFEELSLADDCAMLGVPCGHTAGVAALASLVLAADFCVAEQRAALALTLAARPWHAAALLMPPGWMDAADAGGQAA